MRYLGLLFALVATPALSASTTTAGAAAMLSQTAGRWQGELAYRDYQSNSWQALPVTVTIAAQPDQVTTIRTAQYDDGPKTGIVTITTVTLVDPATSTLNYASFRRSRAPDSGSAKIVEVVPGVDAAHWTMVTTERRGDGNDVAQVRETTTRTDDTMTTLKEVNPEADKKDVWLPRNRTVLRRIGS